MERKVIDGVAACALGAMTSLLLLVIMYTHSNTHGTTDRTINLLISSNVHYVHLAKIVKHTYYKNTKKVQLKAATVDY